MIKKNSNALLSAQRADINPKTIGYDGSQEWLLSFQFHEIGGNKQRCDTKRFRTIEDAKQHFEEMSNFFCKSMARLSHAIIDRKDTELVITVNGVKIVQISYLLVSRLCA